MTVSSLASRVLDWEGTQTGPESVNGTGQESGGRGLRASVKGSIVFAKELLSFSYHRLTKRSSFFVPLVVYLSCGYLLDFVFRSFPGDAVSRMANAFYMLYSRDPHLASVGFVWTPLTSFADFIPLLFRDLWMPLSSHDVAGTLVSAMFMAGAAYQLERLLGGFRLDRRMRTILVATFALNPMIVFFGANGMSEALYAFFSIASTRYLFEWARSRSTRLLAYAGVMLGLGYLARNEVAVEAFVGLLVVLQQSFAKSKGTIRERALQSSMDGFLLAAPFAVCFVGWAVASYVITGIAFQQYSGNQVLVQASGFKPGSIQEILGHEAAAIMLLCPLVVPSAVAAIWLAFKRKLTTLAPVVLPAFGLAFTLAAYAKGILFPWLRYYILAIPLGYIIAGWLLSEISGASQFRGISTRKVSSTELKVRRNSLMRLPGFVVLALGLVGMPTSAYAMLDPSIGQGETVQQLGFIFHSKPTKGDLAVEHKRQAIQAIDDFITKLGLRNGSVVVDNDDSCVPEVLTSIGNPKVFVIPNDRDFQRILADPPAFGTHYLMVSVHGQAPDAISNAYPGIASGANGQATVVATFDSNSQCGTLRLLKISQEPKGSSQMNFR